MGMIGRLLGTARRTASTGGGTARRRPRGTTGTTGATRGGGLLSGLLRRKGL